MTLHFDNRSNFKAEFRTRLTQGYAINSGVYTTGVNFAMPGKTCAADGKTGCYHYDPIPGSALFDAGFTLALPQVAKGASWSMNATNLFDHRVPTFVGVPPIGLMVMTRLQYNF